MSYVNSSNYSRISMQTWPSPRHLNQSVFYTEGQMPGRGQTTTKSFHQGAISPCPSSALLGRISGRRADSSCRKEPGAGQGERSSKRSRPALPPPHAILSPVVMGPASPTPRYFSATLFSSLCHHGPPRARAVSCPGPAPAPQSMSHARPGAFLLKGECDPSGCSPASAADCLPSRTRVRRKVRARQHPWQSAVP